MQALRLLFSTLDHFRLRFALLFIVGIVDGVITFFIPALLAEFTKREFSVSELTKLLWLVVFLYLGSLGVQWVLRRYAESLGPQYVIHLRQRYFRAFASLPLERVLRNHSGYVLSLIGSVAGGLGRLIPEILWGVSGLLVTLILFFYFTARESVVIASTNFVVLLIFCWISFLLARIMVQVAREVNEAQAKLTGNYVDFLANTPSLIRLGVLDFARAIIAGRSDENYKLVARLQSFHAARWFWLHFLFAVLYFSTIGFLLYSIAERSTSPAVLILFVSALTYLRKHIERIAENFKTLIELDAYLGQLNRITSLTEERACEPPARVKVWSHLEFRDVSFSYPESETVLSFPSFEIKRGERVFIAGASGEGKTTFLHLLANLYQPKSGVRLVDDENYGELGTQFFQERVVLISQEVELFHLSLRENISLGRAVEDALIYEFLDDVLLLQWAQELAQGLETQVGEKGVRLSSGQKQRINLVRGLLLGRELVLLDEPTSHMDEETERKIVSFLDKRLTGKTAVIVSHRPAVGEICNRRYVMVNHQLRGEPLTK